MPPATGCGSAGLFCEGTRPINCFVRSSWFCFKWGLVTALVLGLGVMLYLDRRLDEEIRQRVETMIAEGYPNLAVNVRSAHFLENEGISIRGLRIQDPNLTGPEATILEVDEIFLRSKAGLQDLLRDSLKVESFVISRPRMHARCDKDGQWNVQQLVPVPKLGDNEPVGGQIQNGQIEIVDEHKSPASSLVLRDIHLTFSPESAEQSLPVPISPGATLQNSSAAIAEGPPAPTMNFIGSLRGDRLQQLTVQGSVAPHGRWRIAGEFAEVEVSPELHASLPAVSGLSAGPWNMLRAFATGEFAVEYDPMAAQPLVYSADVQVSRGKIDDVRLPYPLTDFRAQFRVRNGRIEIAKATARSRSTEFELAGGGSFVSPGEPIMLQFMARRLLIDRHLIAALPVEAQDAWNKFQPLGEVDANGEVAFDGAAWQLRRLHSECVDLSFAYHKFPYRVEHAVGWLNLERTPQGVPRVTLSLRGMVENVPIDVHGDVLNPGPDFTGWVQVEGSHLRLNDQMIAVLPGKSAEVIQSLDPAGTFSVWMRFERPDPAQPLARQVQLDVLDGTIRYAKFPYPIVNVSGHVSLINDDWRFENFHGINGGAHVEASGSMLPTPLGPELALTILANGAALDEDLRSALPANAQIAWNELKPRGDVDLTCYIKYLASQRAMDLHVDINPRPATCSLEPRPFPYRWENLTGTIIYDNGQIRFTRLRGNHGDTRMLATGSCEMADGLFHLRFDELAADNVVADREMKSAVPLALRQAVIDLNPEGAINLAGAMEFWRSAEPGAPIASSWDINLYLVGNAVTVGETVENLHGRVGLKGQYDGRSLTMDGDLELDSARVLKFQFNQVRGPLRVENDKVVLGDAGVFTGAAANRALDPRSHRHVTAQFYGGRFLGDVYVAKGDATRFTLRGQVDNADINQFSRDGVIPGGRYRGRLFATLDLSGSGSQTRSLMGDGSVQLRDADVYELPLLVALLKVASFQPPDATAFTTSNVEYRISGDRVYFNRLDFNGDAVSLVGKGEMDFDKNVNLSFGSMMGRNDRRIPIVGDVLGEATKQFLKINVSGPVDNPEVTTETFPGVVTTLQQIQAELERGANPPPRTPATGTQQRSRY